ncbi:MAG: hybrid sensor histidine kinase/response regulator [Granulosicoccus sp.]
MVEDDMTYRALCERYLAKDPGFTYDIVGISSAAIAMIMCMDQSFDCLIIDYDLPDTTGTELILSLRDAMGDKLPPAVILTAGGGIEAATKAIRANASDFLSKKDVSAESLCRSVCNAVEKGRMKREIQESNEKLNLAYQKLQRNSAEIKNFYHTISHEVKTPLSAIREFLSLMNDEIVGPTTEQQSELLGYSLESCDQIATHFNDLLDLAKTETGKLKLNKAWDSPGRLIMRSTRGVEAAATNKGIKLHSNSVDSQCRIYIDTNRIVQVLSNLLNNAIRHSEPGGMIQVESEITSHDTIDIKVIDFGCGIDSSNHDRIFDRLYQVNPNDDCAIRGGLGLGLSIARDIAHLHDGKIFVESQPGRGSTFTLQLPTGC